MSPRFFSRIIQAALALASATLIASCGGGGGAGELGSGGTGVGTVTGFGSIYVDGTRFDDSNASVQVYNDNDISPDTLIDGEAKLGQRVLVSFDTDAVAKSVTVQAELVGAVTANAAGVLTVLGQSILVNTDPAAGPVTQLAPYAAAADIAVADVVEVHGVPRRLGNGFVIQATRIEKRAALPQFLRVSGVVAGLGSQAGATRFTLGALTVQVQGAVVVPASRTLADGQSVVVWARAVDLDNTVPGAPTVTASLVRIRERIASPQRAYIGGLVAALAGNRFSIGDTTVDFASAVVTPRAGDLVNGRYVQVRGEFGSDGVLVASEVKVRDGVLDADLRGTVTNYNAITRGFRIRDVNVLPAPGVLYDNCPTPLADLLYVEVRGTLTAAGILAGNIKCPSGEPPNAVIERRGVASAPTGLRTFTLQPATGAALEVRWTGLTFFRDVASDALTGRALRVEGVLAGNGTLLATKIRLDN